MASIKRYPFSGLSTLVVGGGIAGLSFAIEAYRKGHDVRLVDRRPDFDDYGDMIALQQSALRTPAQWPNFMERLRNVSIVSVLDMRKYDGTSIGRFPATNPDYPALITTRSELHKLLYEYAQELGITVEFNATVVDYYETDEAGGVVLSDGRKLEADVVVAADGVGSKACLLVSGYKDKPSSSGSAVYRVTYPVAVALENPVISEWLADHDSYAAMFLGPDAYVVVGRTRNTVCWVMTRKDDGEAEEDWSKTTSSQKALKYVEGWTPFVQEMIKATPNQTCTDWKLMWRDPQDTWVSPRGRVVQIGDSAHSFLPTSGAGGTMAMEDAFSLASCLQLAGKTNVPMALRVHNKLRFQRASCALKTGLKNRQLFHKTDWKAVSQNPQAIGKFVGDWLVKHDPESYVYENYAKCVNHLLMGVPFENTNAVPGYHYKPWTVSEVVTAYEEGTRLVDEGEWL